MGALANCHLNLQIFAPINGYYSNNFEEVSAKDFFAYPTMMTVIVIEKNYRLFTFKTFLKMLWQVKIFRAF